MACQRLVHNGDARTVHRVAVIEFATLDNADAQRLEVPRTDDRRAHLIRVRRIARVPASGLRLRRGRPGKLRRRDRLDPPGRRSARGAGGNNAWKRLEPLDDFALIGPGAFVRETCETRPEPHNGHAIRVEARAPVEHDEAANEQAARAEQQHRQCHLPHDQPFTHDRARPAGGGRPFFHRQSHIGPRGLKCRRDPGRHAGEQRYTEANQCDSRIERQVDVREVRSQDVGGPDRELQPGHASGGGQRHGLDQEQADQPAAAGADRKANRNLFPPS